MAWIFNVYIYTHADTPVFFLRLPQVAFNFKEEDPLLGKDGIRERWKIQKYLKSSLIHLIFHLAFSPSFFFLSLSESRLNSFLNYFWILYFFFFFERIYVNINIEDFDDLSIVW